MIYESTHMYHPDFAKAEYTYVLDDEPKGFFTYMFIQDTPVLQQFYIDPKYRSIKNARALIKGFLETIKEHKRFMISAQKEPQLVEYYFKKKPAISVGVKKFYIIER
jgi:GNAT superfamily N-acetyltransferase